MQTHPQPNHYLADYLEMGKTLLFKLNPFLVIFFFYLFTESNNQSITHDSINYFARIVSGNLNYNPNHLLFVQILSLAIAPFELIFSTEQSLRIVQAAFGALTLHLYYRLLVQRLQIDSLLAAGIVLICAFTYGIWYYSIAIEIYIFPICLLLMAFFLLTKRDVTTSAILTAAILHSLATLMHQGSVLFGVLVVVALFTNQNSSVTVRLNRLILYVAACTILVGGTYWAVAVHVGRADDFSEFTSWLLGNQNSSNDFSFGLTSILLAMVGFARAVICLNFLFAHEYMINIMSKLFSAQSLQDEMYLVRNLSNLTIYMLLAFSIIAGICFCSMFYYAIRGSIVKSAWKNKQQSLLLICWLVPYVLFFTAFIPENADFWLIQVLLVMALLGVGMDRLIHHRKKTIAITFTLAIMLLLVNGLGTVLPANDPDNDIYRKIATNYNTQLGAQDILIMADRWPLTEHINHYSSIDFFDLGTFFEAGKSVEDVYAHVTGGNLSQPETQGAIYFSPDMLHTPSSSLAEYGPEFGPYVRQFADLFCEPEALTLNTDVSIYKLDCD